MILSDTIGNLFDFIPETNIVEEYLYNHSGEFPVYSGQTEAQGILGFIDSYNKETPCVTFTTYGSAGKLFYREGKYTIGRNCMGLRPKKPHADKINLKWFSYSFQNLFYRLRRGDSEGQRSLNKLLLERQLITIPDIDIQIKQLKKYECLEAIQQRISQLLLALEQISNFSKQYPLDSIIAAGKFDTFVRFIGGNSGLTEEFIYSNLPESQFHSIQILTSSTIERTAMGFVSKNAKPKGEKLKIFQAPAIIVARNGYAGTMTYVPEGEFTTNDHAYVLIPRQDWKTAINLEWLIYEYQSLFYRLVTSRSDNATFNKEYAERQVIKIPNIDYQNSMVEKLNQVKALILKANEIQRKVENLLECTIVEDEPNSSNGLLGQQSDFWGKRHL